eukprot:5405983-Prymnesium_polylepis.1
MEQGVARRCCRPLRSAARAGAPPVISLGHRRRSSTTCTGSTVPAGPSSPCCMAWLTRHAKACGTAELCRRARGASSATTMSRTGSASTP